MSERERKGGREGRIERPCFCSGLGWKGGLTSANDMPASCMPSRQTFVLASGTQDNHKMILAVDRAGLEEESFCAFHFYLAMFVYTSLKFNI